ncbi:MAG: hypothetical protein ACRENH_03645 [Gemmatimonadaceae bacterium]
MQNLPVTGDHISKTVVIDGQGSLFVNIGSASNSCQVQNRVDNSPGGGLVIAAHGSRFDPSLQPAGPGYVVTFTPWDRAKPNGKFAPFADGFSGGNPTPTGAAHRPVGLAQAPDGSIYVTDDKAGWIWRIFFVGGN